MTGARSSGCLIHCIVPMQRLVQANGIEITRTQSHHLYKVETSLWDISDEVARKYPEFFIEEDKKRFKEGIIDDTMNKVFLGEAE